MIKDLKELRGFGTMDSSDYLERLDEPLVILSYRGKACKSSIIKVYAQVYRKYYTHMISKIRAHTEFECYSLFE